MEGKLRRGAVLILQGMMHSISGEVTAGLPGSSHKMVGLINWAVAFDGPAVFVKYPLDRLSKW